MKPQSNSGKWSKIVDVFLGKPNEKSKERHNNNNNKFIKRKKSLIEEFGGDKKLLLANMIKPNKIIPITVFLLVGALVHCLEAQDVLRRQQAVNTNQDANKNPLSSLANIQLPPQLAALTPQQLHQLAQLRELQLQQEAAARQQEAGTPAPGGIGPRDTLTRQQQPTAQPAASSSNGQIPQPTSSTQTEPSDDNGAYNESGSELEGVAMSTGGPSGSTDSDLSSGTSTSSAPSAAPNFEVNWNKCPQLEPSDGEKTKKTQVITKCLQAAPIPTNLTRENVEAHREQIATCALRVEGWFDDTGAYKYDKAEAEIRSKKLDAPIELQVLKFHVACKEEANKKFPRDQDKLIDQVQFYQACMDYYISIVCEIEVSVDQ